jgi:hypothetical protein
MGLTEFEKSKKVYISVDVGPAGAVAGKLPAQGGPMLVVKVHSCDGGRFVRLLADSIGGSLVRDPVNLFGWLMVVEAVGVDIARQTILIRLPGDCEFEDGGNRCEVPRELMLDLTDLEGDHYVAG